MPGKRKMVLSVVAAIWISAPGHAAPAAPALAVVVEVGPDGRRTLLECQPGFMPVVTEGPTDEFLNGQRIHSAGGVRKCIEIPQDVRDIDGGSSADITFASGRRLEVVNCPRATVPLVWQLDDYSLKIEAEAPKPRRYTVVAPVLVRCIEVVELTPHTGR